LVTLHFASLPTTADVSLLHDLCAPYGRIIVAEIQQADLPSPSRGNVLNNMCLGRGIVQMEIPECAHLAQQALSGCILFEGANPLVVTMSMSPS
jgi:hypothetical protein